jgi:hypothetical protein
MITLKLLESNQQIEKKINKAIAEYMNNQIRLKNRKVLGVFKKNVESWVRSQPEIQSILAQGQQGSLNAQFGLIPGTPDLAVDKIVNSVVDSTQIKIKKINDNLSGGIDFECQPSQFLNLLGLSEGHVITKKGADLHWLNWLLTLGDKTIVVGYNYEPGSKGRSGGGTMTKGRAFRVSPSFSGTVDNNFITRALSGKDKEISSILMGIFEK